uniref:PPC domain-containing protein n=1 Tax=Steinernema glaseri TaxID=37863 RepID=A0A1I7ZLB2_9BILA
MRLRTLLLLAFCVLAATAESLPDDQLVDAEESHVLEYIESPSGEQLAVCKPGHTGPNCQYPICTKSLPINRHSGSAPPGELIVYGFSESCNSNFSLPIDGEIKGDVTVSIVAGMPSIPGAVLLDSNGKEILANTAPDTPDNQFVGIFRNLVPGLYTVRLSSYSDAFSPASCP